MIAEIYALKRLPRRFSVFDYKIPEGLSLRRGDIVRVTLRNTKVMGLVSQVTVEGPPRRGLKELDGLVDAFRLSEAEVGFYERLAGDLAQSVSSVLSVALPSIPVRSKNPVVLPNPTRNDLAPFPLTLPSNETESVRRAVLACEQTQAAFISVPDLRRTAAVVATYASRHTSGAISLIAPNVRDAELLARHIPHTAFVTGDETEKARREAWLYWRKTGGLLIGTRVAALLPHPDLTAIFVARASHQNHKQEDRNPRFHTLQAVDLLASTLSAKRFFLDAAPRGSMVHRVRDQIAPFPAPETEIVELRRERSHASHPLLSVTLETRMKEILAGGTRVLCVYNRKGLQGPHKEFSNESVVAVMNEVFAPARTSLVDREHPLPDPNAQILVVTRQYIENNFDPFHPDAFGLVAELDADLALFDPNFRSLENAILSAHEWRGVAHACKARFLLQTDSADLFRDAMQDPIRVLEADVATRISYGLPPAVRLMRVAYHDEEPRKREIALDLVASRLRDAGVKETRAGEALELSVAAAQIPAVFTILSDLDDQYIVDTIVEI